MRVDSNWYMDAKFCLNTVMILYYVINIIKEKESQIDITHLEVLQLMIRSYT